MPLYLYKCSKCEGTGERYHSITKRPANTIPCPNCGEPMGRDIRAEMPNVSGHTYTTPLHSDSLAISPSQREEHQRLFPNVELDNQNRPVLTDVKQHDDYIQKRGFEKLPQKTKRRATKTV